MSIRVLLADDHPIMVEGLRSLLADHPNYVVVGEATNGTEVLRLTRELSPDLIIMDIQMPGCDGIEATRQIMTEFPDTKVIALSMHSNKLFVLNMLKAGAKGYLLKENAFRDLVQALQVVTRGEIYLSPKIARYLLDFFSQSPSAAESESAKLTAREYEILKRLAEGRSAKEIALQIGMSTKTVDAARRTIMKKVGVDNLADLVKYAIREGLTSYGQ